MDLELLSGTMGKVVRVSGCERAPRTGQTYHFTVYPQAAPCTCALRTLAAPQIASGSVCDKVPSEHLAKALPAKIVPRTCTG